LTTAFSVRRVGRTADGLITDAAGSAFRDPVHGRRTRARAGPAAPREGSWWWKW
jgi:hypothetical protein